MPTGIRNVRKDHYKSTNYTPSPCKNVTNYDYKYHRNSKLEYNDNKTFFDYDSQWSGININKVLRNRAMDPQQVSAK